MCGIVGYVGEGISVEKLVETLKKLEYRGYDSSGVCFLSESERGKKLKNVKKVGQINILARENLSEKTVLGVAHTRWATHGRVNEANAHPHLDCEKRFALVHNGIIDNFKSIKEKLGDHNFNSETDSEVIIHFIEDGVKSGLSVKEAIINFMKEARGTFAVVVIDSYDRKLYAFKRASPLAVGLADSFWIASDIYAFSEYTKKAIFFDDDEMAVIFASEGAFFYDSEGKKIEKRVQEFEWKDEEGEKEKYEHYMIKEIKESPRVGYRLIKSLENEQKVKLDSLVKRIRDKRKTIFVASGTSYHASLLGVYFLHETGIEAQTIIASEFENFASIDPDTLVIAISQSGETMDVLDALKFAKSRGAEIVSIVNVPYSSVQRMSSLSLEILAGQEICVAATKSFFNQVLLLLGIAKGFGYHIDLYRVIENSKKVIEQNEASIIKLASELKTKKDIYIIGRGITYPVAREIALKLKEIPYIHAEGMMGGELKHGTLALIEEGTPVISLISSEEDPVISNIKEVEARGGHNITFGTSDIANNNEGEGIKIPGENHGSFSIYATLLGQLLAYYIAKEKKLPIDKPRNLAKSVTVR